MLIVMSGLPGTGKSSVADALGCELGAPVLCVDPIEPAIWRCGIPASFATGVAAYEVAAVLAAHQLTLGLTTIVDSVSSIEVAVTCGVRQPVELEPMAAASIGHRVTAVDLAPAMLDTPAAHATARRLTSRRSAR